MIDLTPLPHDRRHFVHKRIGRAVRGFVTSGFNPLSALASFAAPAPAKPVSRAARVAIAPFVAGVPHAGHPHTGFTATALQAHRLGAAAPSAGAVFPGTPTARCGFGKIMIKGVCVGLGGFDVPRAPLLPDPPTQSAVGGAVMGRYGAALTPGSRIIDRAVCLRGMQLGNDGLCYNKGQISNKERMWPRGRRPLLTGGDMRAISIASRAGRRLENTAIRLQEIGLIKKPVARKRAKKKC